MKRSDERQNITSYRSYRWTNKSIAGLASFLALLLSGLARLLPGKAKQSVETTAHLLQSLARLLVRPASIARAMKRHARLKPLLDGAILGGIAGGWIGYFLLDRPLFFMIFAWMILLLIFIVLIFFVSFLSMSGDISCDNPDEFQEQVANAASALTLREIVVLLALLLIAYLLVPAWRNLAIFHISVVLFVARVTYLFAYIRLRWQEILSAELEAEENAGMQPLWKRGIDG